MDTCLASVLALPPLELLKERDENGGDALHKEVRHPAPAGRDSPVPLPRCPAEARDPAGRFGFVLRRGSCGHGRSGTVVSGQGADAFSQSREPPGPAAPASPWQRISRGKSPFPVQLGTSGEASCASPLLPYLLKKPGPSVR